MVSNFVTELQRRQYSPHTVRAYSASLNALAAHAGKDAQDCSHAEIRAYLASLEGVGNTTRSLHVSAFKAYALFLRKTGVDSPIMHTKGLRSPKRDKTLPRPLSEDAAKAVISASSRPAEGLANWQVARNRAMILLMYGAGLRSAELLALPFNAETHNALRVMGKGRKERLVPLLPVVAQSVETYRRAYLEAFSQAPTTLFSGFSDRSLRRLVEGYRNQLGLPNTFTPHALRHSFATHLYQNGADLMVLADLLGHTSVSTTAIYTKVDKKSLSKVLNGCYGDRYEVSLDFENAA